MSSSSTLTPPQNGNHHGGRMVGCHLGEVMNVVVVNILSGSFEAKKSVEEGIVVERI